ncbi:hypothetical protein ACI8AC_06450 [Geodermatophilus sp. SYSU D00758]
MLWLVVAVVVLVVAAVSAAGLVRRTRGSSIGEVVPGRFAAMATTALRPQSELLDGLSTSEPSRTGPDRSADRGRSARPEAESKREPRPAGRRSAVDDAMVPGAIAGAVGVHDWLTPNQSVLEAVHALTHEQVSNSLDLWGTVQENGYKLWTEQSLLKWRGHVGEQQVMDQLTPWLGDRAQLESLSNNPGSDLSIDGRDFNVKVTKDFDGGTSDHFAENPGIPVIVNSDAADIPQDALHVDLSEPFDVAMLDGHHVIVAEGLTLSGAEDALADAFGPAVGRINDAGDVLDAASSALPDATLPVLGSAIRVVRSGMKESALLKHHGDTGRLIKNVTTDVAVTGGGVAAGGTVGHIVGGGIDVLTGGLTLGAGTVLGGIVGSALGGLFGSKAAQTMKLAPLHEARADSLAKLEAYSGKVAEVEERTNRTWRAQILPAARRRANAAATDLQKTATTAVAAADAELRAATTLDRESRTRLLGDARGRVEATLAREASSLARRRAASWSSAADAAWETADVFDVVLASPGGERVTRDWLEDAAARHELVLAAAAETARLIGATAVRTRAALASSLADSRADLFVDARRQLDGPLRALERANAKVRHELVATGLVKPEDVASAR